jgi:hypothetical protein
MSPGYSRKPSDAGTPASQIFQPEESSPSGDLPLASTARTLLTGRTGVDQPGFCDGCHAQGASPFRRLLVHDIGSDSSIAVTATSGRVSNQHPLAACPPWVNSRRRIA